jgi:hypothetical protein
MKSKFVLPLLLISILILSACGSRAGNSTSTAQSNSNTQGLPLPEKLAIGTLKLEGTASAITSAQASDLLPLWQVYSSLIASDTAAQEEKDALVQQIQETMTKEQVQAIENMNLTQRDVFASMQQLGIAPQFGANGTTQQNGNTTRGNGQGGNFTPREFPGGGPGGFGGNGFGGGNGAQLTPQQIATAQARRQANGNGSGGFNSRLLTPLIGAVIKLLESK